MSSRRLMLSSTFAFLLTCLNAVGRADEPNVLLVMLDDAGWTDFGCYGSDIDTPNIDALAGEGVRFTDCHAAAPNCSPSRAGMLTGRMPTRAGIYSYIPPGHPMHLRNEEVTLAEVLKEHGYATGHFGKWHLSQVGSDQQPQPSDQGFDHSLGTTNNAKPNHLNPTNFYRNGQKLGQVKGYSCDIVVNEFDQWLSDVPQEQPFLGVVWFHEPHTPIASPPDLVAKYRDRGLTKKKAKYFANIENVDRAMGRLLHLLKSAGRADNTFLFLTSDNGGVNDWSNQGLRGRKSFVYEGGQREPGILWWPDKIKAGTVSDETVSHLDLFPTICEITGASPPADRSLDGTSWLPHLVEGEALTRETPLLWYFYRVAPAAAMRDGDYVLLGYLDDPIHKHSHALTKPDMPMIKSAPLHRFELYNLATDLDQTTDLSLEHPQRLQKMMQTMQRMHREVVSEGPSWNLDDWRR
ncbi:sulfatase-like hydrolase/transferase [Stratiformator vulcanicus]|uniref:Arylsulfatase n=1 Tax=Stratiformator vulcanicus TaxID=2527980 RepID=A0A517QY77_9PLAN|nr:sulfatase-like hydrolase/transferase [Stratiformator vulcanicus]QDT36544.1 Arylsulfatase [Stratiformator vulcanicus]